MATLRARGGSPVTTWPSMSTSRAARANMFGMMNVLNTSPSAVFDGPGWPMLVVQSRAWARKFSFSTGLEPNGSLPSQPESCGVSLSQALKS